MLYYRNPAFFIVLLFLSFPAFTQSIGANPPSATWKQINTPYSRVIFPPALDSIATNVTTILLQMHDNTQNTIGNKSEKINIIIQNKTTISNGYVALGPFKSEFYLTPPQNSFSLGSIPWAIQLTIHEYRHVQQFMNFNVGFSHLMRVLFGQDGQALANATTIPNWFFEGDAVFSETNYSKQGRGSLPSFYNGFRALWKADKNYSWMKLRNGSLKDFVPNHYLLGYLLVAYGREKFGDSFWKNVTQDAAAFKGIVYPMQKAIKKYSGKNYVQFRTEALQYFKKQWDIKETKEAESKKTFYQNEIYPTFDHEAIIYLKSSAKKVPAFMIKTKGEEKKIRNADYTLDDYFSYRNGKIVYASYRPNVRWSAVDYSELQIIDVTNGHQQTLTKHSKYFSPDISPDGKKIVAVEVPPTGSSQLHLLDASNGKLLHAIPNNDQLFYTYPKFYGEHSIISAVRNTEGKMSLAQTHLENDETEFLIPFSFNVIAFPVVYNDTLYFSYSYVKKDELFAYTFSDKKLWKIESNKSVGIGKYHPTVNESHLAWHSFTSQGNRIITEAKKDLTFLEIKPEKLQQYTVSFDIAALNNINSNLIYKVPDTNFQIKKYPKSFRLFNFHSLRPAIDDPQYTLSFLSENILNTFQSQLSFTYDRAEKFKKVGFAAIYGGLFPLLTGGVDYTFGRQTIINGKLAHFNQFEPFAGFSIPLNLSKGRSFTNLNAGSQYVYNQSNYQGFYKDTLGQVSYSYLSNSLSFSHQVQKSTMQIFPRFAQTFQLSFKTALTHYKGNQFSARSNLYFPGIFKTHSLVLNGAYLIKDSLNQIYFSSGFPFSRGYQSVNFYKMYKWGLNYHFPLWLPDIGFANIIYVKRIRTNIFYDHTLINDFRNDGSLFSNMFRSAGTEINFDTKWWNQVDISFGFRYSYLLDEDIYGLTGRNRWEIILPINIFEN